MQSTFPESETVVLHPCISQRQPDLTRNIGEPESGGPTAVVVDGLGEQGGHRVSFSFSLRIVYAQQGSPSEFAYCIRQHSGHVEIRDRDGSR
jgi:hypothetical protein